MTIYGDASVSCFQSLLVLARAGAMTEMSEKMSHSYQA